MAKKKHGQQQQHSLFEGRSVAPAGGYVTRIMGGGGRFDVSQNSDHHGGAGGNLPSGLPAEFYQGYQEGRQGTGGGHVVGYIPGRGSGHTREPGQPPPFAYHETGMGRIFAGRNPLTEADVMALSVDHGITHVLDLREPKEWEPPRLGGDALTALAALGIERRNLPWADATSPPAGALDSAVAFLADALADPKARVYVHCRAGRGRTGTVLLAYGARHVYETVGRALQALGRGYPLFGPLGNQIDAVRAWFAPQSQSPHRGAGGAPTAAGAASGVAAPGVEMRCDECAEPYLAHSALLQFVCRPCFLSQLNLLPQAEAAGPAGH